MKARSRWNWLKMEERLRYEVHKSFVFICFNKESYCHVYLLFIKDIEIFLKENLGYMIK